MALLKRLIAEGKINPVIDRTYLFSELREAISYLETGNAQGKVVIAYPGRVAEGAWRTSGRSHGADCIFHLGAIRAIRPVPFEAPHATARGCDPVADLPSPSVPYGVTASSRAEARLSETAGESHIP